MVKIKISKQVYAYGLPRQIVDQIKSDLTLLNPKWVDNNRMGRYNRGVPKYLYSYVQNNNRLNMPAASAEDLFDILNKHEIPFKIYDRRITRPIKIRFKGDLREFQKEAVREVLKYDSSTLESPTGSGKTVMGLYMISARSQKTLIIVHTKDLAHQWIERARNFLHVGKNDIGLIGDGSFHIGTKITVALVQSLYKRVKELSREFGHIISDECHRAPSRTFTEALSGFHCRYRLGLTATPYRRDNLDRLIFWYVGPIRHKVNKNKLEKDGYIMMPRFIMRETDFVPHHDPISEYSKMLSELTQNGPRNDLIVKDISEEKGACLIISDRKTHLEDLAFALWGNYQIKCEVLTGSTSGPDRERIIKRVNEGSVRYLLATGQLIGEGFDCKNLDALFIASPIRFKGRVIQYIGRIMRPAKGKKRPVVYDYVDLQVPTLRKSAMARMRTYGKNNVEWN